MNCRRVQKLIPLHVESDLSSSLANRVASHLEECGRCNWLADEYRESQGWLRSYTPPEFDEATLFDLKRGVMTRVAQNKARPSLLASLTQPWTRRPLLALSAGLLLVLGVVVLYIYQARARVSPNVIAREAAQTQSGDPEQSAAPGTPVTAGGPLKGPAGGRVRSNNLKRQDRTQRMTVHAFARLAPPLSIKESANPPTEQAGVRSDNANGSRDVLRIEFQTGDPNIRIIWFAPKETDSHQNKPATD